MLTGEPPQHASSPASSTEGGTSPPPGGFRKRALSNASATSSASNKRALSVDPSLSDTEGSLGTSRLNIVDNDDDDDDDDNSVSPASSPNSSLLVPTPSSNPHPDDAQQPHGHDDAPPPDYPGPESLLSATHITPKTGNAPPPDLQHTIITELKANHRQLSKGDSWYLVGSSWYARWEAVCSGKAGSSKEAAGLTVDDIGFIDNSQISDEQGNLKPFMAVGQGVTMLPAQAWGLLLAWYGLKGPIFERRVVGGEALDSERVEFYPPTFHLFLLLPTTSPDGTTVPVPMLPAPPSISLSSGETLSTLLEFAKTSFGLERPVRFWRLPVSDSDVANANEKECYVFPDTLHEEGVELIERGSVTPQSTLAEALLEDGFNRLAVEEQSADGKWVIDEAADLHKTIKAIPTISTHLPATVSTPATAAPMFGHGKWIDTLGKSLVPRYGSHKEKDKEGGPEASTSKSHGHGHGGMLGGIVTRAKSVTRGQRGLTGLQNLGNTCFMNSALQCMSNTKELQEYFMSGVYKQELNTDNPLGMGGQVAEVFGQLIERLWSSSSGSYAPREFKQTLSRFAPSFSGYGQQDSQEFLAFLLDGIHEDLNRIKKKPATNAPDWMGGGDAELVELAKTCWEQYRSRNDSVIVDLFQGQYRSTVVCPDCDKISITFDPFMYVTTNLPVTQQWSGTVFFVPLDDKQPRYSVDLVLPKNGTLKSIKTALGKFFDLDPKKIVFGEVWKNKFYKAWNDDEALADASTGSDQLIFYETLYPWPQPKPRFFGKTKPAPTSALPDPPAIIPVLQLAAGKKIKSTRTFGARSADGDLFGLPFVLSLPPETASSVEGILRALAKQYARTTTLGTEVVECVEAYLRGRARYLEQYGAEPGFAADLPTAASTSSATAPAAAVALPITPPPDDEVGTAMDVDEPTSATAPTTATALENGVIDPSLSGPGPASTSSSAIHPIPTRPPAPIPIFRVYVIKAKEPNVLPFPSPDYFDEHSMTPLEKRSADAAAARQASQASAPTDEDEMNAEPPTSSPQPLVRAGETLVVEWQAERVEEFYGGDGTTGARALWEDLTKFVDPAIPEAKARAKGASKVITLEDCLNEFTKEERLGEDDTWYCPVCKKHQRATKKVELWKVPDVLVFALKRFSSSRFSRDKIADLVDFPIENFNMEPYVEGDKVERRLAQASGKAPEDAEPLIYDLYAVDNHYGGLGGGHYTAYAKNPESGKWSDYDDSRVTEIKNPASVKTAAAYLLFYRRRTTRPIGAKSRVLVDSAIQSRVVSANNSDAGSLSRPVSRPASPMDDSPFHDSADPFPHHPPLSVDWGMMTLSTSSVRPASSSSEGVNPGSTGCSPSHSVHNSPILGVKENWEDDAMQGTTVELRLGEGSEEPSVLETVD